MVLLSVAALIAKTSMDRTRAQAGIARMSGPNFTDDSFDDRFWRNQLENGAAASGTCKFCCLLLSASTLTPLDLHDVRQ